MSDAAATAEAADQYLRAPKAPQRIGAVAVGRGPASRRVAELEAEVAAWRQLYAQTVVQRDRALAALDGWQGLALALGTLALCAVAILIWS